MNVEASTTHREYHQRIYLNLHDTYPNAANIDTCSHRCLLYNFHWPHLKHEQTRRRKKINSGCGESTADVDKNFLRFAAAGLTESEKNLG